MNEQHTVGEEKVSAIVTRKTTGDLIVSQHSVERWFSSSEAADRALGRVLTVMTDGEHGDGWILTEEDAA